MKDLRRFTILIYFLAVGLSVPLQNFNITFSVALGGAISIANLSILGNMLSKLLNPVTSSRLAGAVSTALFAVRFLVIAFIFFIFADAGLIDFIALLAGLSVTVLSIFIWSLAVAPGLEPAFDANTLNEKSRV